MSSSGSSGCWLPTACSWKNIPPFSLKMVECLAEQFSNISHRFRKRRTLPGIPRIIESHMLLPYDFHVCGFCKNFQLTLPSVSRYSHAKLKRCSVRQDYCSSSCTCSKGLFGPWTWAACFAAVHFCSQRLQDCMHAKTTFARNQHCNSA